jgi:hypothetical protein
MKSLGLLLGLLVSFSNGSGVPGFSGRIVVRDEDGYEEAAYQYATTSMPEGEMRPKMILYAQNDNDVIAAINYAKKNNVAIAVRTGGHQYSGASSAGGDNIQLDLSRTYLEYEWHDDTSLLRIGISWGLTELATKMSMAGLFVPHGVCGDVHLGGHMQTGGWGMRQRGFGLLGDHVQSFEIITADGNKRTVQRNAQTPDDKDLFYAVLGGSPGNFGVLTHVTLRVHRDSDHPDSRALYAVYLYSKPVLAAVSSVVAEMSEDDNLARDWDVIVTLQTSATLTDLLDHSISVDQDMINRLGLADNPTLPIDAILITMSWHNVVPGETFNATSSSNWFKKVTDAATSAGATQLAMVFDPSTHTPESVWGLTELFMNVREFAMPFNKSARATNSHTLVQDGWVDFLTNHIDAVITTPNSGLHLVLQWGVIGGRNSMFRNPPTGETAYSWRDTTAFVDMDAFYEVDPSNTAQQAAAAFEAGFAQLVGPSGIYSKTERRVLWGSFGDHTMHLVWPYYYENRAKYDRLVRIKQHVDPMNVFTPNTFVVGDDILFQPHGKLAKAKNGKVTDAEYAPKLAKECKSEFEALMNGKKQPPSGPSGKPVAIAAIPAAGAAIAVFLRRRRNRTPKPPSDANFVPASTEVAASV